MSALKPFYGVSSYNCNNRKLFNFVQDNQKTGKTVLEFTLSCTATIGHQ